MAQTNIFDVNGNSPVSKKVCPQRNNQILQNLEKETKLN